MDPNTVSPWLEFGLPGLFGIFALVLTGLFLRYLALQSSEWREHLKGEREQRKEIMNQANGSMKDLGSSLRELDKTIQKLNGGSN